MISLRSAPPEKWRMEDGGKNRRRRVEFNRGERRRRRGEESRRNPFIRIFSLRSTGNGIPPFHHQLSQQQHHGHRAHNEQNW
jgi:hypothetical protein